MPLCSQCTLPSDVAGITLDDRGVCNQCRTHHAIHYHGEAKLIQILDACRDRDKTYDCMVNISGGRDSTYTLLSLVKDHHLRVLAVNYANPFTDPQAIKNIQNTIRILGVDFVQFSLKKKLHENILRNNILTWFKNPSPAMVPAICIGCKIIWPKMLKIARQKRIRCIVNGGNPFEYTSFKKELLGVADGADLKSTYFSNFTGLLIQASKNSGYLNPRFLGPTLQGYLFGNPYAIGSRLMARNITFLDFFHYVPWRENDVLARIQEELEWDFPKDLQSTWRFDCEIAHLKDYMYKMTLGMTEKDDFYAKLIREGQISRYEAIQRLEKENRIPIDRVNKLLEKVDLKHLQITREDPII
ncbi:ATPase [bacterium]|nr:ATPase [bacterium]MBU1652474.1 ATPase [bacterium]